MTASVFDLARHQNFVMQLALGAGTVVVLAFVTGFILAVVIKVLDALVDIADALWDAAAERRRQRQITDDVMKHQRQKELHQAVRHLVQADQRKRHLEAVVRNGSKS